MVIGHLQSISNVIWEDFDLMQQVFSISCKQPQQFTFTCTVSKSPVLNGCESVILNASQSWYNDKFGGNSNQITMATKFTANHFAKVAECRVLCVCSNTAMVAKSPVNPVPESHRYQFRVNRCHSHIDAMENWRSVTNETDFLSHLSHLCVNA